MVFSDALLPALSEDQEQLCDINYELKVANSSPKLSCGECPHDLPGKVLPGLSPAKRESQYSVGLTQRV